jgi:hypothetical protein
MMLPIFITNLPKLDNFQFHYDDLLQQHKNHNYPTGNSFMIDDKSGVWGDLYNQFLNKTAELFGDLYLLPNNKNVAWCYANNKDWYKGGIHNHMKTSVINAVYYFSVPETKKYREGALAFYNEINEEVWAYKPRESDLVIFPNYLKHQPLPVNTEKFRFSINMEIFCKWPEAFGVQTEYFNFR